MLKIKINHLEPHLEHLKERTPMTLRVQPDLINYLDQLKQRNMVGGGSPQAITHPNYSWVVYGYKNCPYCKDARRLLDQLEEQHDWHPITRETKANVIANLKKQLPEIGDHSTVPIIFHRGQFIGGFQELQNWFINHGQKQRSYLFN